MENSSLLEQLLLENKSLSTLFQILLEPYLKFYQENVLKKIKSVLECSNLTTKTERISFTEAVLDVEDNVELCYQILKLIWKDSDGDARRNRAASRKISNVDTTVSSQSANKVYRDQTTSTTDGRVETIKTEQVSYEDVIVKEEEVLMDVDTSNVVKEPPLVELIGKTETFHDTFSTLTMKFRIRRPPAAASGLGWLRDALEKVISIVASENYGGQKALMEFKFPDEYRLRSIFIDKPPNFEPSLEILINYFEEGHAKYNPVNPVYELEIAVTVRKEKETETESNTVSLEEYKKFKNHSIIDPEVKEFSLPIALLLGETLHVPDAEVRKKLLKSWTRNIPKLKEETKKLIRACGCTSEDPQGRNNLKLLELFDATYPEYHVSVYNTLQNYKSVDYTSSMCSKKISPKKRIHIFHDTIKDHYFCISNVKYFFRYKKECFECGSFYNTTHDCTEEV